MVNFKSRSLCINHPDIYIHSIPNMFVASTKQFMDSNKLLELGSTSLEILYLLGNFSALGQVIHSFFVTQQ